MHLARYVHARTPKQAQIPHAQLLIVSGAIGVIGADALVIVMAVR